MRKFFLTISAALTLTIGGQFAFQPAYAACAGDNTAKGQVQKGIGATGDDCNTSGVTSLISTVVKILSIIVGIAAIIMIIVSGMKFITSGGDSGKVASARSSLLYALIGLAIAALAQFLVNFVFTASKSTSLPTCKANQSAASDNCREN
jgi:uncharacterized membrane protein YuzA (DUF378 family)